MTSPAKASGPYELVASRVTQHLDSPKLDAIRNRLQAILPGEHLSNIDVVLKSSRTSYRDVLIVQLAYRLATPGAADLTIRHSGARTVGQKLGKFFAKHHIRKVQDAYQNIGKNTTNLTRGNFGEFDSFLRWASAPTLATDDVIEAAFDYACAVVASTARPVSELPPLNRGALTFARTKKLLHELFKIGSQGAYEQFTIAALLAAVIEQTGSHSYRVETKKLFASDKSSRTAGDVQILAGNRVVEAYEVTAADWETKLSGAAKTVRDHDLTRIHIVAAVEGSVTKELLAKLERESVDVSVLSLPDFADSLTSALTRPFREFSLVRLYELLERYQPDIGLVNRYVNTIQSHRLHDDST